MEVKDMKIMDVLQLDAFQSALTERVNAMRNVRELARIEHGNRLASHPIDYFIQYGYWNAEAMTTMFESVLDKVSFLPRSKREFVLSVCVPIFKKVMQRLIDNEKKSEEKPKKPKKKRNFVTDNTTPTEQ